MSARGCVSSCAWCNWKDWSGPCRHSSQVGNANGWTLRALAAQPKVLLLDEPFGVLDAKVRLELRQRLRWPNDELHVTSVFVTHDQEEAFEVADRVIIMNKGTIERSRSDRT